MRDVKESKFVGFIKKIVDNFSHAMHPEGYICIGCGAELKAAYHEKSICPDCAEKLRYRDGLRCQICGNYINEGLICHHCADSLPDYDKAYALFDYGDLPRRLIISYKDGDKPFLAKYIADYLADYALAMELVPMVDCMCFVPSTPLTLRERGFDHGLKLAKHFSERTGLAIINPLIRVLHPVDQSKLSYGERFRMVQNAFKLSPNADMQVLVGKRILLLDDVLTTGATASACAKLLKSAGAESVIVLTFAR